MRNLEFDFSVNLLENIIWQYDQAINLLAIIKASQNWFDKNYTVFWQNWFNDIFNLQTANDFGLAVWSIILNQPLYIGSSPPSSQVRWGYGSHRKNYGHGNYAPVGGTGLRFSLEEKRIILRLRFYGLMTRGSTADTNRFLKKLLDEVDSMYVLDGLNMSMRVIFLGEINYNLRLAFKTFDLIPRPAAVQLSFLYNKTKVWGYGSHRKNYGHGNYYPRIIYAD